MLTKNDKKFLEELARRVMNEALTVKVRMERRRDPETGQPLAAPVIEEREIFLPAYFVEMLPYLEGALRGVQETTDHVKNTVSHTAGAAGVMADLMIRFEGAMKSLVRLAEERREILPSGEPLREITTGGS